MSKPLASRLETHILTSTLTLIASLLATLMLLWHLSTTHLIESHGMPEAWAQAFLKMQFSGLKGVLWWCSFVVVRLPSGAIGAEGWKRCRGDAVGVVP